MRGEPREGVNRYRWEWGGHKRHAKKQKKYPPAPPVIEVVEEDAAQPAGLPSVCDAEVLVAPLLELGVELGVVAVARLRGGGRGGGGIKSKLSAGG